jgi:hypothetical protein
MNTNEKINNTIDELKKVLERHADSDDAKSALVNLEALLDKKINNKKDNN